MLNNLKWFTNTLLLALQLANAIDLDERNQAVSSTTVSSERRKDMKVLKSSSVHI